MELKDLVGLHTLSGVSNENKPVKRYSTYEDSQVLSFILDGITYTAVENPDDGYRSSMDELVVNGYECDNLFEPIEVQAVYRDSRECYNCDLLDLISVKTGKLILTIGTDNVHDYYPSFVGYWIPENISQVG